ncbi:hypothetical protein DesfrDRAFT_1220 [Solidesulfovibrio fructosivorans JJ]]|uniref:Uncharacterized protein n=1 Tax=Solidesulfovibrio fructosivorans JJ] TaxID=596151 RepID=E1JUC1_SOLFR|nr:hypothetical protein [Solidesulfovibrio fructosivorans]EFL52051.1 hypothetical protein DesfrDRAFT_1220 [Solidesulfovibrio fructosivorans JJ]]
MTIGSDEIRIISGHDACAVVRPAFQGYSTAVVEMDGQQHTLFAPATWSEVVTRTAAPPASVRSPASVRFTPAEFMRLFNQDELDAVLVAEATDSDVKRMWAFIRAVGYVDMAAPLTQSSLRMLREKNYLATDERLQQLKDGVFQL